MHLLRPVVLAALLASLAGCQSAAPAPCLIQRPSLGGYTMKLTLQGTAPAGCETILPPIFGDNWRLDGYSDRAIYMKSDLIPWPPEGGNPDLPVNEHPSVQKAQATLDKAAYDLERTVIRAPENGIVTKVEQLQVGSYVNAATPVFPMISDRVWVEANFKETELTHMRPGQIATVEIDTYPDAVIEARVESLSPGTGLTFSLLPAENATGNWVKVVQRLPVRLSLLKPPPDLPLHAGLSATVEVDTHYRKPWLVWLTEKAGPLFGTAQAGAPPGKAR